MNWLSVLSEQEKREIVGELARRLAANPEIVAKWESSVERALDRYGFKAPQSSTSVLHSMTAQQSELEAHESRLAALHGLIREAKDSVPYITGEQFFSKNETGRIAANAARNRMLNAIIAAEREFKLNG